MNNIKKFLARIVVVTGYVAFSLLIALCIFLYALTTYLAIVEHGLTNLVAVLLSAVLGISVICFAAALFEFCRNWIKRNT